MFFAPRKPQKNTVFQMVFASGSNNHGIYSVFWTAPSKTTDICAVFGMLQEVIFPCESHKTRVNYSVLGLILGFVTRLSKMNSNFLNNQVNGLTNLPLLCKAKLKVAPLELPFVTTLGAVFSSPGTWFCLWHHNKRHYTQSYLRGGRIGANHGAHPGTWPEKNSDHGIK